MKKISNNIYFSIYRRLYGIIPDDLKGKFVRVQVLIVVTTFVDLFGLAIFIPVLTAVTNPTVLNKGDFFSELMALTGVADRNRFLFYVFLGAFFFFVLRTLFILYSQWVQAKFVFKLSEIIGTVTYRHYLYMNYDSFVTKDSAEIIRNLTVNPLQFSQFLIMSLFSITSECLVIAIIILSIAMYNFKIFLLLGLSIAPPVVIFYEKKKKKMNTIGHDINQMANDIQTQTHRGIYGYLDVFLRGKQENLIQAYTSLNDVRNKKNVFLFVMSIIPSKIFEVATVTGLVFIVTYGILFPENSNSSLPLMTAYAAAGYRLIPSLNKIAPSFLNLKSWSFLFSVYSAPFSTPKKSHSRQSDLVFKERIALRNINYSFKKNNQLFFQNLNLQLMKGEVIGIIGKSGSGKTTLAKIIAGFLFPDDGSVEIDGQKVEDTNRSQWMSKISYVQQAPYIEKGTLAGNIAFLDEMVDEKRLMLAIEKSALNTMLHGSSPFEFAIDENGKNLSGGQKQRIVIARALYYNAELIILDEATSALDTETEKEINETVSFLKGSGITVIIIAHRHSTLRYTDKIYSIEKGKIAEEFTYESLTQSK